MAPPAPVIPVSQVNGILRACCGEPANLQLLARQTAEHRHGMIVQQCRVCGRRHYVLRADPGAMGMMGARL